MGPQRRPQRLRPGLYAVRRDDRHLQVGIDPPWRVLAPDEPEVRRLLEDLESGRPATPTTPATHRTLAALDAAGMLVPAVAGPGADPHHRLVAVEASGSLHAEVVRVLRSTGAQPDPAAGVVLVAAAGEVARPGVDAHQRDGTPHLVLSAGPAGWTVGPFVVPGATACLRCVDAHRGELDPRRALVVDQLAGRNAAPDDPVLAGLAVAWAVRDVLTHLDGGRPSTWSATVGLGADLQPDLRSWRRHPHCGCAWR